MKKQRQGYPCIFAAVMGTCLPQQWGLVHRGAFVNMGINREVRGYSPQRSSPNLWKYWGIRSALQRYSLIHRSASRDLKFKRAKPLIFHEISFNLSDFPLNLLLLTPSLTLLIHHCYRFWSITLYFLLSSRKHPRFYIDTLYHTNPLFIYIKSKYDILMLPHYTT